MIRQTVKRTMAATWVVRVPNPKNHDFPTPCGTGFFVSPDGLFITALHVANQAHDLRKIQLTHEAGPGVGGILSNPDPLGSAEDFDIGVLKFDFEAHCGQEAFKGKDGFDFLEMDFQEQYEGTPVYSFGYPLPEHQVQAEAGLIVGLSWICPRVTSAIISSRYEVLGPVQRHGHPQYYVLDKAFNYGNSGGPIVLQESGKAIAVVVRFQPVEIAQQGGAAGATVTIPSLYGVASSLTNINWDFVRQATRSTARSGT